MRRPREQLPDLHARLLAAFRDRPGVCAVAARAAGCDRSTAVRGWRQGWPRVGLRPIRGILEEEKRAARAVLASGEAAERDAVSAGIVRATEAADLARAAAEEEGRAKGAAEAAKRVRAADREAAALLEKAAAEASARRVAADAEFDARVREAEAEAKRRVAEYRKLADWDAVQERAQTADMVRRARMNAYNAMGLVAVVMQDVVAIGTGLRGILGSADSKADDKLRAASLLVRIAKEANHAGMIALDMENELLGLPNVRLGGSVRKEIPIEEAARTIDAAARAVSRGRARGLRVLTGGVAIAAPLAAGGKP